MHRNKFLTIMSELHSIDSQLQQLENIYSPESINYHHMREIDQLNQEVRVAQVKLGQFQEQIINSQHNEGQQNRKLKRENQELLTINEELVKSNDRFKDMFEKARLQRLWQQMAIQLKQQQQQRKTLQAKHAKELEHLKLIHAQELYILKKKQKKG